jgi:hypothetical protein
VSSVEVYLVLGEVSAEQIRIRVVIVSVFASVYQGRHKAADDADLAHIVPVAIIVIATLLALVLRSLVAPVYLGRWNWWPTTYGTPAQTTPDTDATPASVRARLPSGDLPVL